jgi:hypothetical protein
MQKMVDDERGLPRNLLSLAARRTRHVGNEPNVERYNPDLWKMNFISQSFGPGRH